MEAFLCVSLTGVNAKWSSENVCNHPGTKWIWEEIWARAVCVDSEVSEVSKLPLWHQELNSCHLGKDGVSGTPLSIFAGSTSLRCWISYHALIDFCFFRPGFYIWSNSCRERKAMPQNMNPNFSKQEVTRIIPTEEKFLPMYLTRKYRPGEIPAEGWIFVPIVFSFFLCPPHSRDWWWLLSRRINSKHTEDRVNLSIDLYEFWLGPSWGLFSF